MDTFQFLGSVFLVLWKCNEITMQNITFNDKEQTWQDAANFCSSRGGVLESNLTVLREQNANNDVWIGKFRILTNWTYIRGCYLIHGNFQHFKLELANTMELQCQMLCDRYTFYSSKGADCFCIEDVESFTRSKNCSCDGCSKVWEHRLPSFRIKDKRGRCIATSGCESGKLIRSYMNCDGKQLIICDNDVQLGYDYSNYQAAADNCKRRSSFIKWHSNSLCNTTDRRIYWTSGTQHIETFRIRKAYSTENLQPEKCYILKKDGEEDDNSCNSNNKKRFFCRFGTDEDKGDIISIPDLSMMPQKSVQFDDSGSIVAGVVTSIIVVIAVILVLVFIYRRRLSRKKPTSHESQNNSRLQDSVGLHSNHEISKTPIYHEIDTENFGPRNGKLNCPRAVNNMTYDQTPNSKIVNQSTNSSILTNVNSIEHQRKVGHTKYDMPKLINETWNSSDGANSSNYCLAEPIATNTEEELDPYDINKDYDHLNNVQKKEDQITKVYDHLPTAVTEDPTYDHTNLNSALDNEDFYDHFKNAGHND